MRFPLALALITLAAPLAAHPHIFINTGLKVLIDEQNRLTHVEVTWEYDDLYSLLVTEDLGIDADYNGVLTAEDKARLTGFDMQWIEGYNGDLVAALNGARLDLSGPSAPTATLDDGRVITTHVRAVNGAPVMDGTLSLRPYDGSYYTAYDVERPVTVEGRTGCDILQEMPDMDGALAMTKAELSQIPEDIDLADEGYGDIGARFATDVRITCAAL
ncbi:DUF1007 family protein [uncultured Sulfitobacter sp.]|uniref:DUF1007 family protein n=1 Tax=uncultured Sulfitobacter sp. TaxID=191468 RepID=UPI0026236B16|nr:DUF1007 family protein [uncultured Sulfitobacter sp.]